jgi:hypothetical protein
MNHIQKLLILSFFIFLGSCQKKEISKLKSYEVKSPLDLKGIYQAKLRTINPDISKYLNGSLSILIENNLFHANIRFSQGPIDSLHEQAIYKGERCPEKGDDLNGDGLIDLEEASKVFKGKIVPLDDDLSSQRMGSGIYPKSDQYGSYLWGRKVLLEELINDLKDEDLNPHDDLIKLDLDDVFQLENLLIIVKGIHKEIELPDTVASIRNQDMHDTFPIACGIIKRITKTPGIIDHDIGSRDNPGIEEPYEDGADFSESDHNEGEDYGDLTRNLNEFLLVQ